MKRILFLAILFGLSAAQAQQGFYAFGPKAGQPIPTEEEKQNQYQNDSLQQMKQIGDMLKAQQDASAQQLELLKQQNQLLNSIAQQLQYQSQLQAAQQGSVPQQAPAVAPVQQYAPAQ